MQYFFEDTGSSLSHILWHPVVSWTRYLCTLCNQLVTQGLFLLPSSLHYEKSTEASCLKIWLSPPLSRRWTLLKASPFVWQIWFLSRRRDKHCRVLMQTGIIWTHNCVRFCFFSFFFFLFFLGGGGVLCKTLHHVLTVEKCVDVWIIFQCGKLDGGILGVCMYRGVCIDNCRYCDRHVYALTNVCIGRCRYCDRCMHWQMYVLKGACIDRYRYCDRQVYASTNVDIDKRMQWQVYKKYTTG